MNLLVPVDFSDVTGVVLDQVKLLAGSLNASVTLLHAVPPDPDFVGYEVGPQHVRDHLAEKFHQEHRQVQALGKGLEEEGITATALLLQGPTVETILEESRKLHPAMIIMGSHGHGALYHALLGSVSEGVLKQAPCPVLLVPASPR